MQRRSFLMRALALLAAPFAIKAIPAAAPIAVVPVAVAPEVAAPIIEAVDPILQYMQFRQYGGGTPDPRIEKALVDRTIASGRSVPRNWKHYASRDPIQWDAEFQRFIDQYS